MVALLDVEDDPRVLREVGRVATSTEQRARRRRSPRTPARSRPHPVTRSGTGWDRRTTPGPCRSPAACCRQDRPNGRRPRNEAVSSASVARAASSTSFAAPGSRETAGDGAGEVGAEDGAGIDGAVEGAAAGEATADADGDAVSGAAALHEARASARPSTVAADSDPAHHSLAAGFGGPRLRDRRGRLHGTLPPVHRSRSPRRRPRRSAATWSTTVPASRRHAMWPSGRTSTAPSEPRPNRSQKVPSALSRSAPTTCAVIGNGVPAATFVAASSQASPPGPVMRVSPCPIRSCVDSVPPGPRSVACGSRAPGVATVGNRWLGAGSSTASPASIAAER